MNEQYGVCDLPAQAHAILFDYCNRTVQVVIVKIGNRVESQCVIVFGEWGLQQNTVGL